MLNLIKFFVLLLCIPSLISLVGCTGVHKDNLSQKEVAAIIAKKKLTYSSAYSFQDKVYFNFIQHRVKFAFTNIKFWSHTGGDAVKEELYRVIYDIKLNKWLVSSFKFSDDVPQLYYRFYDLKKKSELKHLRNLIHKNRVRLVHNYSRNTSPSLFLSSVHSFKKLLETTILNAEMFDVTSVVLSDYEVIRKENLNVQFNLYPINIFEDDKFYIYQNKILKHYASDKYFFYGLVVKGDGYLIFQNKDMDIVIYKNGNLEKKIKGDFELPTYSFIRIGAKLLIRKNFLLDDYMGKGINTFVFDFSKGSVEFIPIDNLSGLDFFEFFIKELGEIIPNN